MNIRRFAAVLIIALTPSVLWSQGSRVPQDTLWSWSGTCDSKTYLVVELVLDGKMIYKSSFPICQISARSEEGPQKELVFYFKGGHTFQGEYHTLRSQKIEGNIWQAGADPDAVILGVSFATKKRILLNTLHVAKPDSVSRVELDRGLFIRTFPEVRN